MRLRVKITPPRPALMAIIMATIMAPLAADIDMVDTSNHKVEVIETSDSSAADTSYQGRIKKYTPRNISDQTEVFELNIKLPPGMKFNPAAPFVIEVSANKPEIIEVGVYDIKKGARRLKLPVNVKPGEATLIVDLNFSYCGSIDSTLCYFEDLRLEIPVKITDKGSDKFAVLYEVFE